MVDYVYICHRIKKIILTCKLLHFLHSLINRSASVFNTVVADVIAHIKV